MPSQLDVGFYGKLPSHGDFLRRRVSDGFVDAWDGWLQASMAASRIALGDEWLDIYLTSPAWRFACAPGAAGDAPVVGVMVPSVDRVGRYFPLTIVGRLPGPVSLMSAATLAAPFFDRAEHLAIDTLERPAVDFELFDRSVLALGEALEHACDAPRVQLQKEPAAVLVDASVKQWHVPVGPPLPLEPLLAQLAMERLDTLHAPLVFWWTQGSAMVDGSFLMTKGLPTPDSFAAFLDGAWHRHLWRSLDVRVEDAPVPPGSVHADRLLEEVSPLAFRSAALSDVGRVRKINQDSFLERAEAGVWVVADGLGGHEHGEVASRMVCDALADVTQDGAFADAVETACERLRQVNGYLIRSADAAHFDSRAASTVVALLARGTESAIIWVGDSRVYRLRGGQLEQLTHDHSLAAEGSGEDSHVVTRAVGGDSELEFDVRLEQVRDGDRFLLCSDGLTRTVSEAEMSVRLRDGDVRSIVQGLIDAALAAGAPDNVTALIVEARA